MITFTYKLTSYLDFLEAFAQQIGESLHNYELKLPPHIGEGFMKAVNFNDVSALFYNVTLTEGIFLNRLKDESEFYTLNLEELPELQQVNMRIGNEELASNDRQSIVMYLTSFLYDINYTINPGANVRGMRICLSSSWLQQYLHIGKKDNVLEQYINLKTAGIWHKAVDPESRELFDEMMSNPHLPLLSYQNKSLRLVEKFFNWLYNEMQLHPSHRSLSRTDIMAAHQIAALLTTDVTIIPPTIKELSRQFAMSESKLKKVFKTVFGLPPYEYFQKYRMEKAKHMLLSGNYAIKDVGYTLGYSNLSNFTLAFKKEFGKLPSEVVKEAK